MIEISGKEVSINRAEKAGLLNGRNNMINWTAHSKLNRNIVYNAKKAPGNTVTKCLNIIDDRDYLDFAGVKGYKVLSRAI